MHLKQYGHSSILNIEALRGSILIVVRFCLLNEC